jgi:uncharacterized protein (DUF1330 family)
MRAYGIFQETVNDEATFAEYRKLVMPTLAAHDGRFVVRGGALSVVEGQWPHPRLVIIEFPSRAAAENWYRSPEYQAILPLRLKSAVGNAVFVDGVD